MAVLAVLLVIAALMALILACSVRLGVRYDDTGAGLTVKIACFRLFSIPGEEKKPKKEKKEKKKKPKKPAEEKAEGAKKKSALGLVKKNRRVIGYALRSLAKLPGKTVLRRLRVHCLVGGLDDPFKAAMMSSGGFAAESAVRALLDSSFSKVRNYSFITDVDFFASRTVFDAEGEISLRIWHLFALAVSCAFVFVKNALSVRASERKKGE